MVPLTQVPWHGIGSLVCYTILAACVVAEGADRSAGDQIRLESVAQTTLDRIPASLMGVVAIKPGIPDDLHRFRRANIGFTFTHWSVQNPTATIIPLIANLPILNLRTTYVAEAIGCEDDKVFEGVIEISDSAYLTHQAMPGRRDDAPFDVLVLYPANPIARSFPVKSLTREMIPRNVPKSTITAAVDLGRSGRPDLIVSSYCCVASLTPPSGCDHTCQDYYQKKSGSWVRVRQVRPCSSRGKAHVP
jgi:hypothetical protein